MLRALLAGLRATEVIVAPRSSFPGNLLEEHECP